MDEVIPICVPGREVIIFPAALVARHLSLNGETWTPTVEQVAEAERVLPAYLVAASPQLPVSVRPGAPQRIAARLDQYARQYFGISRAGRRLLYINCLPANHSNWRTRPVFVKDGGESFFRLMYDPATGTFDSLAINGEA